MVEITLGMGVFLTLSALAAETFTTLLATNQHAKAVRRVTELGSRTADEISRTISGCRRMFFDDDTGHAYLSALDLDTQALLTQARLPRVDVARPLGPDLPEDPRTGNVLLYAEAGEPLTCVADAASRLTYRIDVFRIVCIYVHETTVAVVSGGLPSRDLIVWRSKAFPSYGQITQVKDPLLRCNLVRDLVNRHGLDLAWASDKALDQGFYRMDILGNVAAIPEADMLVERDPEESEGPQRVLAGVQLARTTSTSLACSAVLTADDPEVWVPDGFEVKVVGPDASRHVWLRIVLECQSTRGAVGVHATTRLVLLGDT